MSLTLKVTSLAIRTLAKPMANRIKRGAHEHERFRRVCVRFAQGLHRIDMRMRLGLLQDPAVIDRQIAKEVKAAEAARRLSQAPTVKTEAETAAEENMTKQEREDARKKVEAAYKPRIRPLSESKAIETGANFISEAFIFAVAVGVIVFEQWRQRRKAQSQRDDIREDLEELQVELKSVKAELEELKARHPEHGVGLLERLKGKGAKKVEEKSKAENSPSAEATTSSTSQTPTGGSSASLPLVASAGKEGDQPAPVWGLLSFWKGGAGTPDVEEKGKAENETLPDTSTTTTYEMQPPSNPSTAPFPTEKK